MEVRVVGNSSQGELLLQLWCHLAVNVPNSLPHLYNSCLQHTICTEAYGSYVNLLPSILLPTKFNAGIYHDSGQAHSIVVSMATNLKTLSNYRGLPIVYCDGSCFRNGTWLATAGIGVYWGPDHAQYVEHSIVP